MPCTMPHQCCIGIQIRCLNKMNMKIQLPLLAFFATICLIRAYETNDKQPFAVIVDSNEDQQASASGFHGNQDHHSGKYFQYTHVPAKDHYEFGHKRGNEHHFIERHEKAHPHAGEFKTKVRWGDKHGGYGEHYWDFNHAGHDHDDGHHDESQKQEQYVQALPSTGFAQYAHAPRGKRQHDVRDLNDDVEFISDRARSLIVSGVTGKHGGNYRKAPEHERGKREHHESDLLFNPKTGLIVDEQTGVSYQLQPVEKQL